MDKKDIDRINELARKRKTIGLTDEETLEQTRLRRQYIDEFKASLQDQLDHTMIQNPDGSRVPLKRKADSGRKN